MDQGLRAGTATHQLFRSDADQPTAAFAGEFQYPETVLLVGAIDHSRHVGHEGALKSFGLGKFHRPLGDASFESFVELGEGLRRFVPLLFAAPAIGDVEVDRHHAAPRQPTTAHFEGKTIRPDLLGEIYFACEQAHHHPVGKRFRIVARTVFAGLCPSDDDVAPCHSDTGTGRIQAGNFNPTLVPGDQLMVLVVNGDAGRNIGKHGLKQIRLTLQLGLALLEGGARFEQSRNVTTHSTIALEGAGAGVLWVAGHFAPSCPAIPGIDDVRQVAEWFTRPHLLVDFFEAGEVFGVPPSEVVAGAAHQASQIEALLRLGIGEVGETTVAVGLPEPVGAHECKLLEALFIEHRVPPQPDWSHDPL